MPTASACTQDLNDQSRQEGRYQVMYNPVLDNQMSIPGGFLSQVGGFTTPGVYKENDILRTKLKKYIERVTELTGDLPPAEDMKYVD